MPRLDPSALNLDPHHRELLLSLLARHVPEAEAWAYGSRVTGGAHEGSDLDLVLRNPADPAGEIPGLPDLVEALEQSRLPMQVEAHLWAHLPPAFHAEIELAYVVLSSGRTAS